MVQFTQSIFQISASILSTGHLITTPTQGNLYIHQDDLNN
ncbi:hypothetical protein DFQ11_101623 [Winogradskyella epiphytica]|uniref:Uncharacterized protein n=1 Tax=Winogradskyella epiphytica TaxID=262005 RepID=A0A2V4WZW3_9FLAO|nr:hypothetical protein DFQ11_101623 [Winogradskyella epiphytica]